MRSVLRYPSLADTQASRLHKLADALNIPLVKFWANVPDGDHGDAVMVLRLWSAITDPQARARVLVYLRTEAERAGFREY